jgi:hypothetical protein
MTDEQQLRKFAQAMFAAADWPEGGDIDGFTFQDIAVECGLLRFEKRYEPCGDRCHCAGYYGTSEMAHGVTCYRKTALLTGDNE